MIWQIIGAATLAVGPLLMALVEARDARYPGAVLLACLQLVAWWLLAFISRDTRKRQ